jgi:hypothetical protein
MIQSYFLALIASREALPKMTDWTIAHLTSALIVGGLALIVGYFAFPSARATPNQPADAAAGSNNKSGGPLDHASNARVGYALLGLAICALLGLAFSIGVLAFLYGVVVLVFRHAFGIELPFGRFS